MLVSAIGVKYKREHNKHCVRLVIRFLAWESFGNVDNSRLMRVAFHLLLFGRGFISNLASQTICHSVFKAVSTILGSDECMGNQNGGHMVDG